MSYYKSSEEFLELMTGSVSKEYSVVKGTWLWEILKAASLAFSEITEELDDLLRRFYAEDLAGDELDAYIKNWSYITRKKASAANGYVTFYTKASQGGTIPSGTYLSNGAVSYKVLEEGEVLAGGSVTLEIKCTDLGEIGNTGAGTVNRLLTNLSFIEKVTNERDITGGEDRENDSSLRERFFSAIKKGANAGNKAFYEELAENMEGVGKAICEPVAEGEGTAWLYIVNSDGEKADSDLIAAVQAVVDPNINGDGSGAAPIGATVTVLSPGIINIRVSARVKLEGEATAESIYNEVYGNIKAYLDSCSLSGTVLINRVGKAILEADGVFDYIDLLLNDEDRDIGGEDGEKVIYHLAEVVITV